MDRFYTLSYAERTAEMYNKGKNDQSVLFNNLKMAIMS